MTKSKLLRAVRQADWLSLLLLVGMLVSLTWSVEKAQWVSPLPSLSLTVAIAALAAFMMFQIRLRLPLWHLAVLLLGCAWVLWQIDSTLPTRLGWIDVAKEIIDRVSMWLQVAQRGGISNDPLPFIFTMIALAWLLGYFGGWLLGCRHQGFWATIPSGLGMLLNLYYAPRSLAFIFIFFLVASMLLVIRTNQMKWERRRQDSGGANHTKGKLAYGLTVFSVCLVMVFFVWQLPLISWAPSGEVWSKLGPWKNLSHEFERLFPMLASERSTPMYTFGGTLPFRGPINLSGKLVFQVITDDPGYWRGNTYEIYTAQGWLAAPRTTSPLKNSTSNGSPDVHQLRKEVIQTVQLGKTTDIFFATGTPVTIYQPALAEMVQYGTFSIDVTDRRQDDTLPVDLRTWAQEVRSRIRQSRQPVTAQELSASLPKSFNLAGVERRGARISTIQVQLGQSEASDISALRSPRPLQASESYTITSSVSVATAQLLRPAGDVYPDWLKTQYLQLPTELPERIRQLAKDLTQNADTPFDKATAIETYLRSLAYRLDIKPAPTSTDAVDYFLFTSKTGYCDYFASAMAVMLRSIGIPSRVVAGYATGEFDSRSNSYVVRENDAHSWPEVYFPGYGWESFEPTPIHSPIAHGEEQPEVDTSAVAGSAEEDDFYDESLVNSGPGFGAKFVIAAIVVLLGLALGIALIRYLRWRWLSRLGYEAQIYEKMCRLAGLSGLAPKPNQTPWEFAHTLAVAMPLSDEDINTVVSNYVKTTYGGSFLGDEDRSRIERAWLKLRRNLWRRVLRKH